MEEQKISVPYIVHEGDMARLERTNKRLWILSLLLAIFLVGSNVGWIWYESQFEDVVTTTETYQDVLQDAEGAGYNTFVGGDYYGEAESSNEN